MGYDFQVKEGKGIIIFVKVNIEGKEGVYIFLVKLDWIDIIGNFYGGVIVGIELFCQLFLL